MQAHESLFAKLRTELAEYLNADEIESIYQAYLLAADAHKTQTRKTGEPYIIHPVAVSRILTAMHMDAPTIMAAMLHDVIEDTPVDKDTLIERFGNEVADLVDGVSKLTQIKFESRAEAQAENFRKMVLAMVRDIRVIVIKLADRLHNMRTLGVLAPEKRRRIAIETLEIFAPIAHRLGMHQIRIELEDLGFASLYPLRYRVLQHAIDKMGGNHEKIIQKIEEDMLSGLQSFGLPEAKIRVRSRHLYSLYKKMKDQQLSFSEVTDVFGFRVIVEKEEECYRALGAVHRLFKPVPERFKDYIAIPKSNGYQALHTTLFGPFGLPLEIQIRTEGMDRLAEKGIVAHWLYKSMHYDPSTDPQERAREWMQSLLELQENTGSSLEFIENVKIDLFPEEVYVFTPKGDIIEMPGGSTVVDFAYAIHSDIGNTCVAAKIDRRLAPLSMRLVNGQTVSIITAPGTRPNPAWLNFVVTGKARSNIRHFLNTQRRAESIALGQRLLQHAMGEFAIEDFSDQDLEVVLSESKFKKVEDLFEAIALGQQAPELVAHRLLAIKGQNSPEPRALASSEPLMIKGSEGIVVQFSECCRPIPGDDIIGLLRVGRGLMVHMDQCSRVRRNKVSEQLIAVCWEDHIQGDFKVDVRIEAANQRGVLAKITAAISESHANIDNITVAESDGRYKVVNLSILVHDRAHLATVMRRVRSTHLVDRITRVGVGKKA